MWRKSENFISVNNLDLSLILTWVSEFQKIWKVMHLQEMQDLEKVLCIAFVRFEA